MVMTINATLNETRKGLTILWDYKFSLIIQLFGIGMVFIGIMFFMGEGELAEEQLTSGMLGFLITFYAMEVISNMSWSLMNEAQTGTLEQMYMSPAPSGMIVFGRSLASLVSGSMQLVLIAIALILLFQIEIPIKWEMLPILLITMVGLTGFGYVMGGLTLVFKQVGPIANIAQNLLLFTNGTFLPIENMPDWMAGIAELIPSTQGIVVMRQVALDGLTLSDVWNDGSLVFLIVHSVVFLILGWAVFTWCENIARNRGSLGQY